MVIDDSVTSTSEIHFLGSGVYKVLSVEDWNLEPSNLKSLTFVCAVGSPPSQTPATVVIPEILIASALTIESTIPKDLTGDAPVLTAGFV